MGQRSDLEMRRKWFTIGVAISLSAATFAEPLGSSMEQPWRGYNEYGEKIRIDHHFGGGNSNIAEGWYGKASHIPWTGPWLGVRAGGGSNVRWRNRAGQPVESRSWLKTEANYLFTAAELARMSEEQIRDSISAMEKLDIVAGNADPADRDKFYRNVRRIRDGVRYIMESDPSRHDFSGICHGLASASIALPEPNPVTIHVNYTVGGRSVDIPVAFGTGDLKILAAQYYADHILELDQSKTYLHLAGITNGWVDAGTMHLLLTNVVGKDGSNILMDIQPGEAIWNYSVAGYRFETSPLSGTINGNRALQITMKVDFMNTSNPTQDPLDSARTAKYFMMKTYRYWIELDASDQIIGSAWVEGSDRPDVVWKPKGALPFTEDYAFLTDYWKSDGFLRYLD